MHIPVVDAASDRGVARGYILDGNPQDVVAGSVVSTLAGRQTTVRLATTSSSSTVAGIVSKDALVSLTSASREIDVIVVGTTDVLVSDINGPIVAGDRITASPIEGVGMRATTSGQVIGTAQETLGKGQTTRKIKDRNGKTQTVHLGTVLTQVGVGYYEAPENGFIPPLIQDAANSLAGRQVSLIRVVSSSLLILLAFVSAVAMIYTSIRSGLNALGRNPLASKSIRHGLLQVGITAVLIIILTLLAGYLVIAL